MKILYRLSSKSHNRPKFPGITKEFCFLNTLSAFPQSDFIIFADNCDNAHIKIFKNNIHKHCEYLTTNLGNCGCFRKAMDWAIARYNSNTIVYMAEDDYIYKDKGLEKIIEEGLKIGDYVTLYDHLDKYGPMYDFGEISKVMRTDGSHWKTTISTTMTFATRVGTLIKDRDIWWKYTQKEVPEDHEAFCALNRKLVCPIPGLSCHTDLNDDDPIEHWVFSILKEKFKTELGELFPEFTYAETPERQLMIMQTLLEQSQHVGSKIS